MKPSKRKRRIQAIKARLKEYYHLKEKNNYFKRNFIELTRPTKAEYAANKNYVDTQISTISQFDSSSDQTISGTWEFSKPLKITEAQLADEAVSKGYVDETIQQNLNTTLEGVIKFVSMTEAEYKALETKSPSTIYHLTDVSMWAIGDQEIVTSNMPV